MSSRNKRMKTPNLRARKVNGAEGEGSMVISHRFMKRGLAKRDTKIQGRARNPKTSSGIKTFSGGKRGKKRYLLTSGSDMT